jgi:hypothetical protein
MGEEFVGGMTTATQHTAHLMMLYEAFDNASLRVNMLFETKHCECVRLYSFLFNKICFCFH